MATDPYEPLVADVRPLNQVKYAARDYPSILDSLLRRLKLLYLDIYNDFAVTSEGVMLMELVANAISELQWYLDRSASDSYLSTSRTESATSKGTNQIGYKMDPAASSNGTLTLTFTDGTVSGFTMHDRWQYQGPESLVFESYAEKIVAAALSPGDEITVDGRQGETNIVTYTSDGTRNQGYQIARLDDGEYVAQYSVEVWVDGSEWEEKEFLEYEKTNHFEVNYLLDPPTVRFGDGSAGNVPPETAEVKIRYVVIKGADGNVNADTIQTSLDTLVIGGNTVTFTVNNDEKTSGGTNPEDINRAKRIAPVSFAARGAAITEPDYEALSLSYTDPTYGSVALSYAFNPRSSYEDITFNLLIDNVQVDLSNNVTVSGNLETAISDAANASTPLFTQMTSDLTDLETWRVRVVSDVDSARTYSETAKGQSQSAVADAGAAATTLGAGSTEVEGQINDLIAWIDASATIPANDQLDLKNNGGTGNTSGFNLEAIRSQVLQAKNQALLSQTSSSSSVTASSSAIDGLNSAYDDLTNAVPVSPAFTIISLQASLASGEIALADLFNNATTGLIVLSSDLQGQASSLSVDVNAELSLMHTRIGELFNADCLSNSVQVPILALDSEGSYVAPSSGLIVGLQEYLDGIKEVTQQVDVVDGSSVLVPAEIIVYLKVLKTYVTAQVKSKVLSTIRALLKGRSFKQPLYLDTLYEESKASTNGIDYINIEIVGPVTVPPVIDTNGNLVPADNQVVVEGSVTINILENS